MQVGGDEAALYDYARGGPQWGADALIIGPPQVMHSLCKSHASPPRCIYRDTSLLSQELASWT